MDQDTARPRVKKRWILFVLLIPAFFLASRFYDHPVSMSDDEALALTLNAKRSDGLTYRSFVATRFRRERCAGRDPGTIEFKADRTGGQYEFIRIRANAWESGGRCPEPFAVVAGIPLARSWDDPNYPEYRGHLGEAMPADKGMDDDAEPAWLADFRAGVRP